MREPYAANDQVTQWYFSWPTVNCIDTTSSNLNILMEVGTISGSIIDHDHAWKRGKCKILIGIRLGFSYVSAVLSSKSSRLTLQYSPWITLSWSHSPNYFLVTRNHLRSQNLDICWYSGWVPALSYKTSHRNYNSIYNLLIFLSRACLGGLSIHFYIENSTINENFC